MAYILVKVIDEFRGMKPQEVVQYIEGDVLINKVPVDPGFTNNRTKSREKADTEAEGADLSDELNFSQVEVISSQGTRVAGLNTVYQELNEGINIFKPNLSAFN